MELNNTAVQSPKPFAQTFFHGTKANLNLGDFVEVGNISNFGINKKAKYIYFTATLDFKSRINLKSYI